MSVLDLEDFGTPFKPAAAPASAGATVDRFDDGYNAGWDDAMARIEADQARVGERLAERLIDIEHDQRAAMVTTLAALEPALRDIFDTLLPRAADRAFITVLLEEIEAVMADGLSEISLLVGPESVSAVERLLEDNASTATKVTVRPEPALSASQALLRWAGEERRIDLEGVLDGLDSALETFLATMDRGQDAAEMKEAQNG